MVDLPALAATASNGEGWRELGLLGLAFLLSTLIGLERELRHPEAVMTCTGHGWAVTDLGLEASDDGRSPGQELTTLTLQIQRGHHLDELAADLREIPGVLNVTASQVTE